MSLPFVDGNNLTAADLNLLLVKTDLAKSITSALNSTVLSYADFSGLSDAVNIIGLVPIIGATFSNPSGNAQTLGGFLVPTTTTFYYARQDHATQVDKAVVEFSIIGPVTSALPGITIAIGAQPTLAVGVLHLQTNPSGGNLMVRQSGGNEDFICQFPWDSWLLADGTIYRIEMVVYGDRVLVKGPNGESFSITDKRIQAVSGNSSFFEAKVESNGSYPKVKRFYTLTSNTANYPAPFELPTEINALSGFSHNGVSNPSAFGGTPSEISFSVGAQSFPQVNFGPSSFFSVNVLASISIGASTLQVDSYIPNGSYKIDLTSSGGANVETITVTGMAGATSPYTASISGTFSKNHTVSTRTAPVTCVSTFQGTAKSIFADQFGLLNLPDNTTINGGLRLRNSGDYYSTVLSNISTNYAKLFDIGPANPSSLGVTGGFRVVEGSNHYAGVATLVAGTVTVSTTAIATGDRVTLHRQAAGGTLGHLSVGTIINGTSFVITSSSAIETSVIFWEIRRPG